MIFWYIFFFGLFIVLKIEDQQRKALEEDPSVFDYDGVYDEMKEKAVQPKLQERKERKVMSLFYLHWFYIKLFTIHSP